MIHDLYPALSGELSRMRRDLAPGPAAAFHEFGRTVFGDGALSRRIKQIVAVAVAHATQCPYCIRGHTRAALLVGVSEAELMEAIWIAAEMRAGAAFAHSLLALDEMREAQREAAIRLRNSPPGVEPDDAHLREGAGSAEVSLAG